MYKNRYEKVCIVETHGDIDKLSGNCQAATRQPPDSLLAAVGRIEATGRMQTTFQSADERQQSTDTKKGSPQWAAL